MKLIRMGDTAGRTALRWLSAMFVLLALAGALNRSDFQASEFVHTWTSWVAIPLGLIWAYATATDPHAENRMVYMKTGRYMAVLIGLVLQGCCVTWFGLHHGIGVVFTQVAGERKIETAFAERLPERSSRGGCRYQATVEWPLAERNMTPCVSKATWMSLSRRVPVTVTYDSSLFGVLFQQMDALHVVTPHR